MRESGADNIARLMYVANPVGALCLETNVAPEGHRVHYPTGVARTGCTNSVIGPEHVPIWL